MTYQSSVDRIVSGQTVLCYSVSTLNAFKNEYPGRFQEQEQRDVYVAVDMPNVLPQLYMLIAVVTHGTEKACFNCAQIWKSSICKKGMAGFDTCHAVIQMRCLPAMQKQEA